MYIFQFMLMEYNIYIILGINNKYRVSHEKGDKRHVLTHGSPPYYKKMKVFRLYCSWMKAIYLSNTCCAVIFFTLEVSGSSTKLPSQLDCDAFSVGCSHTFH